MPYNNDHLTDTAIAEQASSDVDTARAVPPSPRQSHIPITGGIEIDDTIYALCPQLINSTSSEIRSIAAAINDHIFGRHIIIDIIRKRTNSAVADIIEGFAIIARTEGIDTIAGIEAYINDTTANINAIDICGIEGTDIISD